MSKKDHEILVTKEMVLPHLIEQVQKQIEEELIKMNEGTIVDVTSVDWVAEGIKVSFTTDK